MPTGVYPRSRKLMKEVKKNLAKGREKKAREKAATTLQEIARDPAWRRFVSERTKQGMAKPGVRTKHIKALRKNQSKNGPTWTGGNGTEPSYLVQRVLWGLKPLGFVREFAVNTASQTTGLKCPHHYKLDFAIPKYKIAIELDGPCHRTQEKRAQDIRKNKVMRSMGWKILRIPHK